ncbi:50S ribosomal protein L6 [Haliangium ochraceum]|uniref:Large ribosomal subunit protein uL6 n=1 Tax=Haliangium ochraceum (strain DSM 14365 / JCM 11303 / SMP-2) TaxID=502025 RepID=D0LIB0_HALO1|nr:50S ribosomal protein L6 [Haliangium ochraceum]ACY16489.1 ribosomal protein L6 [Haliangium ochraceum DSM 14365]
MSRVGKKPIPLPKGVDITIGDETVSAKGPKGSLSVPRHTLVDVKKEEENLTFEPTSRSKQARAAHGLMRALCANMVHGVSQGFQRELEINGVGYRAEVKGDTVTLNLGYSHPIDFKLPEGVSAKVDKNILSLSGIDKAVLGQTAAKLRGLRPPEPYKGKGVKYKEEHILRKAGKAAG